VRFIFYIDSIEMSAARKIVRAPAHPRIEMKNGAPVPCREWCHGGMLGVPTPANPPKYPEEGCMGHKVGGPCMVRKGGRQIYFAHPDQSEWQHVPGVAQVKAASKPAIASAEPEWRQGAFASVKPAGAHQGKTMRSVRGKVEVPEIAIHGKLGKPKTPPGLWLKDGELSWGDYMFYQENPHLAHHAERKVLPGLEGIQQKRTNRTRRNRRN